MPLKKIFRMLKRKPKERPPVKKQIELYPDITGKEIGRILIRISDKGTRDLILGYWKGGNSSINEEWKEGELDKWREVYDIKLKFLPSKGYYWNSEKNVF